MLGVSAEKSEIAAARLNATPLFSSYLLVSQLPLIAAEFFGTRTCPRVTSVVSLTTNSSLPSRLLI